MALSAPDWAHVLSAAAFVGVLGVLFVRARTLRATAPPASMTATPSPAATAAGEGAPIASRAAGDLYGFALRVALPLSLLVIATGAWARATPWAGLDPLLTMPSYARLGIWLILLVVLATGVLRPLAQLARLEREAVTDTPATDRLWSEWRTALASAALLALVSVALAVGPHVAGG